MPGSHNSNVLLNHNAKNNSTSPPTLAKCDKNRNDLHSLFKSNEKGLDEDASTEQFEPRQLDGYVGFANLPNQVYRKSVKKAFEFTLMVVGQSGLGKSTLINSMFLADIYNSSDYPGPTQRLKQTISVETTKVMLKENGVSLLLTIADTPGFGDAVDNSDCWVPILEYIESKYEKYLNLEARVTRQEFSDERVHCCLYFIRPSGHGLKSLDVEFMKRLCSMVNVIPVIAKADTLTADECALFKKQIRNEITQNRIKIYEFPDTLEEDEEHRLNKLLRERVPFAVVGSNTVIEADGKKVRGRKYPWGTVNIENLDHCDFIALKNMLIRTQLQDLKDVTNNVHYENYRVRRLATLGVDDKSSKISNKVPLVKMEDERRAHDLKMRKMEAEMKNVFQTKVREKMEKLKATEAELIRQHTFTKTNLEQEAKKLEDRRRQFELEKEQWEKENKVTVEELRRRFFEDSRETADGKKERKKKGIF